VKIGLKTWMLVYFEQYKRLSCHRETHIVLCLCQLKSCQSIMWAKIVKNGTRYRKVLIAYHQFIVC